MSDPENPPPASDMEVLRAQLQSLRDGDRRLMDTVKVCAGLLLGMSAILVVYAWFASHKNYEQDKLAIQKSLETANEVRYAAFVKELDNTLNARLATRDQAIEQRLNEVARDLRAQLAVASAGSTNPSTQQSEEINRKILLMSEVIENRSSQALGLVYFDHAIRSVNTKLYPAAAEYFLAAGQSFLRAREEASLQTCLANALRFGFPNLRQDDFEARPAIEERYNQLVNVLEKANLNGKYAVALRDLNKEFGDARKRPKAK